MRVLDLFSGTGSATEPFADRGHDVTTVDSDDQFEPDIHADVRELFDFARPGLHEFVWASPPCTAFSVASIGHHWTGGYRAYQPKTDTARDGQQLVADTIDLIRLLDPDWWVVENPRGLLRKLPVVRGLQRVTVTYCQYGDTRMKPTDLWGQFPDGWMPRPMCSNGDPCHEPSPRGAKTGTQGIDGARDRARVPYELGLSLCLAAEGTPEPVEGQLTLEAS